MWSARFFLRQLTQLAQQQSATALLPRSSAPTLLPSRYLRCAGAHVSSSPSYPLIRTYVTGGRPKKSLRKSNKTSSNKKKSTTKPTSNKKKPSTKKTASSKKTKRPQTESQLITAKVSALRKVALLDVPKQRPDNLYTVFVEQNIRKGETLARQMKEITRRYRTLGPSDRESLNQTAINNRLLNDRDHKTWVRSYTADQIRLANNARVRLNRLSAQRHAGSKARYTKRFALLKDDRQVKRPRSSFIQYMADRWATGDFKNSTPPEAAKVIGQEWRALSESDRKKYVDQADQRKEQWLSERAELYPSIAERKSRQQRSASTETLSS